MGMKEEERTAARDFVMARLAAARAHIGGASDALDELLQLMVDPDEDRKGKRRAELLEAVDAVLGEAATSMQIAQAGWSDCDPAEGEPEPDDDDEEDDDEDEDDDE